MAKQKANEGKVTRKEQLRTGAELIRVDGPGLTTPDELASSRRLSRLGGTEPELTEVPRRRSDSK